MSQIILHIGAPRTGTSTLQKHILPLARNIFLFSKEAYKPSLSETSTGSVRMTIGDLKEKINEVRIDNNKTEFMQLLMTCLLGACREKPHPQCIDIAMNAISKMVKEAEGRTILFSSEKLCDTSASLQGDSHHTKTDTAFGVHSLSRIYSKAIQRKANICLCLREPIEYLRSKYLRTVVQRHLTKSRQLSASEYIHKQTTLETSNPGTSALAPAMHAEFIKQLQQHAFVKAFGFQELLASDDVFSLMGLQGEDKYAFRDFPRENKLPFAKEQEQAIEVEMTQALKQYGFYDRIMKAQIFE